MIDSTKLPARMRWARFRFGVIAPLLTAPPEKGELGASIAELASRAWLHPTTGETLRVSAKSIERWYYVAREHERPLEALARKVSRHAGTHPSLSAPVAAELRQLRRDHPRWSYQLVYHNQVGIARQKPELGVVPAYATVRRYMKEHGLGKHRKPRRHELLPGNRLTCHVVAPGSRVRVELRAWRANVGRERGGRRRWHGGDVAGEPLPSLRSGRGFRRTRFSGGRVG
jgi:hypothetical protein